MTETKETGRVKTTVSGYEGEFEISFKLDQEGMVDWLLENYGERWLGAALLERQSVRKCVMDHLTGENYSQEFGDVPSTKDGVRAKLIGAVAERICATVAHGLKSSKVYFDRYFEMRQYAEALWRGVRDGSITKDTAISSPPPLGGVVDWNREFKDNKEFAEAVREAMFAELVAAMTENR